MSFKSTLISKFIANNLLSTSSLLSKALHLHHMSDALLMGVWSDWPEIHAGIWCHLKSTVLHMCSSKRNQVFKSVITSVTGAGMSFKVEKGIPEGEMSRARWEGSSHQLLEHNLGLTPENQGTHINIPLHRSWWLGDGFSASPAEEKHNFSLKRTLIGMFPTWFLIQGDPSSRSS